VAKASDLPKLRAAPKEIVGRVTDEATMVRWVAANIDAFEPDPKTCPAPFAWTLLRQCRDNPEFLDKTFLPMWQKLIPPRSQLENSGPKVQDGQSVIDLMDRILDASRKSQGLPPVERPALESTKE
jgi:hypothetical protein